MAITVVQLLEALTSTSLLSPAEVQALDASLQEKAAANPEELVRELVRTGKLTRYQAAAVFQGKAATLLLGNYLLLDKIGAGGMGQVFRARHRKMDRIVAIKVLPKKSLASPDAVERFQREVKAAARLTHGNIVTAHDADEAAGVHFLVMEYVEGTDLAALVKSQGPLPIAQAVSCILQAARGLQHAHAEGVIHRDIKPSNLLLDKRGRVKILDMGLARFSEPENAASDSRDTATRSELTQTGSVMGTVDYMAPEQAIDTHGADHRADIYSLGCTLYYLLTGGPPYTGETMMKRLVAHRETPVPSLRAARPEVPLELDETFRRMVAKNVANRFQTMSDVIGALDKSARGPSAASAAPEPTPASAGRSRWPLIAGVAGAIVVLIAAAIFFTWGGKEETAQVAASAAKQSDNLLPAGEKPAANPSLSEPAAPPAEAPKATPDTPQNPPAATKPAAADPTPPAAEAQPVAAPSAPAPEPAMPAPVTSPTPAPVTAPEAPPPTAVAAAPIEPAEPAGEASEPDRLPEPSAAAREAASKVIQQIFADDYAAAKTSDSKAELAKKLLAQAECTNDDPAAKYVLLCAARDLAADAADTATVDQVAETLASLYQVDALAMQVEIYQKLAGKSRPAAGNKALAESALALAERAVEADNLDAAEHLLKVASIAAGKARAADLVKQAKARGEELADQKREAEAVRKAEAALVQSADDPAANLTLGKYLCFSQDDWEQGLPHLAKGSDAGLKSLAAQSLATSTDAMPLAALADAWWDAAETHKGKDAEPLRAGARHWYAAALPDLSGIVKAKVEKRLLELSSTVGPKRKPTATGKAPPEIIEMPLAPGVTLKFRLIPAGTFQMGSPPTEPQRESTEPPHEVKLTKPFYMAITETTQSQWLAVIGANPSKFQGNPLYPIENVTWGEAQQMAAALNQSPAGKAWHFRLPTEAEWEYACRAGSKAAFSYGADAAELGQYGWYIDNSGQVTHPIGQLKPNAWGLYDMQGNVCEWCADWYNGSYYKDSPTADPTGPATGRDHPNRGGCSATPASHLRSADRRCEQPHTKSKNIGFRLVCEPAGGFKAPPRSVAPTRPRSTSTKRTTGRGDLLAQINLQRDVFSGKDWSLEGGKLITPTTFDGGGSSRLVLPFIPPPEYSLHMIVTPRTGTSFFVGLATGGTQCGVYLEKGSTGMGMIDGLHPQKNSTTTKSVWEGNKPIDLVFEVRRAGITLKAGGQVIFAWTGEPRQLSLFGTWQVPNPNSVFIGTGNNSGTMEISRLEVGPVDAPAKPVAKAESRSSAAVSKPVRRGAPGPLAVAPFSAEEAKQFQESWATALGTPATITNSVGMQLTIIPAGEFIMGSTPEQAAALLPTYGKTKDLDTEQPQHKVRLTKPFYFGVYEVTQQEYAAVTGSNPSAFSATGKSKDQVTGIDTTRFPVEMVSWNEAAAFCQRLSSLPAERGAGRACRLPTEAEWEFACRAGTTNFWHFGDERNDVTRYGWCMEPKTAHPHPVGGKQANPFGLFDMIGNVQECCLDWFDATYYAKSPAIDPTGPTAGQDRAMRSASFLNSHVGNRSAARHSSSPDYHFPERGLRVVCVTPAMTVAKFIAPSGGSKPAR